jgi:hypothetical protein
MLRSFTEKGVKKCWFCFAVGTNIDAPCTRPPSAEIVVSGDAGLKHAKTT